MKRSAVQATSVATPATAAETVVATISVPLLGDNPLITGVVVDGVLSLTPGATASSVVIRVRRTNVTGAVVGPVSPLYPVAPTVPSAIPFSVFDVAPVSGGSYVVTVVSTAQSGAGSVNSVVVTATAS